MGIPFTEYRPALHRRRMADGRRAGEPVINPATEAVIGEAPVGDAAAAEAAIAAARHAFDHGPWPRLTQSERAAIHAPDACGSDRAARTARRADCGRGWLRAGRHQCHAGGCAARHLLSMRSKHSMREEPCSLPIESSTPNFLEPGRPASARRHDGGARAGRRGRRHYRL